MDLTTSIIMPSYNSENYIRDAIESVKCQTLKDWELIIVDDNSSDDTVRIIQEMAIEDDRIHLYKQECNQGAGAARTRALKLSNGRFIAYLDADDLWYPDKLEKQIGFMIENGFGFSCTSYEVINNDGVKLDKKIYMLDEVDYKGFLLNNLIQTVGIMVDTEIVDKNLLKMPDLRRRQDAATWLKILKAGHICYGMRDVLALYRRTDRSLSSNKFKAAAGIWNLYRNVEELSFPFAFRCYIRYAVLAVWKRTYPKGKR